MGNVPLQDEKGRQSGQAADLEPRILAADEVVLLGELSLAAGDAEPSREAVERYIAALLQAEHLNVLIGSGLTTALGALVSPALDVPDMNTRLTIDDEDLSTAMEDAAQSSASRMGRGLANIEDRLRIAIAAADGLTSVGDERVEIIQRAIDQAIRSLREGVIATERAIRENVDAPVAGSMTVRGLLMTFLGSFAGRVPTRDRLHIFTTNYDRLIEWGAELAGLRIVDRFVGSLEPIFRSSRLELDYHYSPPGTVREPRHLDGVFRLTKLHGSLDWRWEAANRRVVRAAVPFGEESSTLPEELLIYPNAAKDVETTFHPYSDLFRDYSAALCRPHSALVTYGYSFGDDHINRVVKDMLTIPSTHLLVLSYDDTTGRIREFAANHRRLGQVSLMIGPSIAALPTLVDKWLPWPSAEFLLHRRAQIYRERDTGRGLASSTASEHAERHDT